MTTLVVSPDFASHYTALAAVAAERRRQGERVVVATGPALRTRVLADGFEHAELALGPESNGGLADPAPLRDFFDATRRGMVATIAYQVRERMRDMLWQPVSVARRLEGILAAVEPRQVLADQLSYNATIALRALEQPYVSLLPSHPCQLPPPGGLDGFPVRFPRELTPPAGELEALRALCAERTARFTAECNRVLARLNPAVEPLEQAVSAPSPLLTLVGYPAELAPGAERPGVALIGSTVREETADLGFRRRRRTVFVGFGTFLSARDDVLATVAAALRRLDVDVILASGVARLRNPPRRWHVRPVLPQVAALAHCDAVICHGGNNTVMEALTAGLPVLAAPFSSDQFVAAEDLRRGGVGDAFDPNRAGAREIAERVAALLDGPARERAAALGACLRARPGPQRAWELVERQCSTRVS